MKIKHDAELAAEMKSLSDPTDLRAVRLYLQDPSTEIEKVILVQGDHRLEEVAAVFAADDPNTVMMMISEGAIKFGVETLDEIRTEDQDCAVVLGIYPDDQFCEVVCLPPFCIVKMRIGKRYS